MNIKKFRKGFSHLRTVLSGREDFSGQFASTSINKDGSRVKLIWNSKTDNVVGFQNNKGRIFFRPNSIYIEALKGKYKVTEHDNLSTYRSYVGQQIRKYSAMQIEIQKAYERLKKNNDKAGVVKLIPESSMVNGDRYHLINVLTRIMHSNKDNARMYNTMNSMSGTNISITDGYVYLNIQDLVEQRRVEELTGKARRAIAVAFVENKSEILENQGTYTNGEMFPVSAFVDIDGVEYKATIHLDFLLRSYTAESIVNFIDIQKYEEPAPIGFVSHDWGSVDVSFPF